MIIVIIIMITMIVIVITIKVVVLIITIIMALCSHDHVPRSPQESQHCQCSAFLVELIENHDCDQTLILITPNYCNTAATTPRQYNTRDRHSFYIVSLCYPYPVLYM